MAFNSAASATPRYLQVSLQHSITFLSHGEFILAVRPVIQLYGKRDSDVYGGRIILPRVKRLNVVRYLR